MPVEHLTDRGVVRVAGEGADAFLDRIVTGSLTELVQGRSGFGALLSPQGKILADFIVHVGEEPGPVYHLDTAIDVVPDLVRRLSLYRLRAKIDISDRSDALAVVAGWGEAARPAADSDVPAADPRLAALGWRAIVSRPDQPDAEPPGYQDHRILCGIPEGGRDFPWGDAFPHEALMDQLGGVDFRKGCYVGQEVVSRMQHRGTARTRIVPVLLDAGPAIPIGAEIVAGDRPIGRLGSSSGQAALATLRLDRVADALAAAEPLQVAERAVRLAPKPDWIGFPWPAAAA